MFYSLDHMSSGGGLLLTNFFVTMSARAVPNVLQQKAWLCGFLIFPWRQPRGRHRVEDPDAQA